jgi:hypothetical protein
MRRMRRRRLIQIILKYLGIFSHKVGQHLNQFGNLVRQDIPDADDTEIENTLLRLHRAGIIILEKYVPCGPFFNFAGRFFQGGLFYGYHEWPNPDDFFRREFRVGLTS